MNSLAPTLSKLKLVAFDVDGVFTDGRFYLADDGTESKAFNTQDGYGIRRLLDAGIEVAVISGRQSSAVQRRMQDLGVQHLIQACGDKVAAFNQLIAAMSIHTEQCMYVGDDLPDLPLLKIVGYSVAVANAVEDVRQHCDYTTRARGGFGAVREVCDLILGARTSIPG